MAEHGHHHHDHGHDAGPRLWLAVALTLGFAAVEAVGGWWAGSLALLGDAGHMVTDSFSLGLAAVAARLALRPATTRHSYGLVRMEVIAALTNGLLMMAVVTGIALEAVDRFRSPTPVAGLTVMVIAAIGLAVNIVVAWVLHRGEQNLNVRGAMLHVLGDLLGSVAALTAGAVIHFTGWTPIDPILALVICALILTATLRLLREAVHVVMEGVPPELDLEEIGRALAAVEGVESVHDLHVWALTPGQPALSAHVILRDIRHWESVLPRLTDLLEERFGIGHVTLQPETGAAPLQRVPAP